MDQEVESFSKAPLNLKMRTKFGQVLKYGGKPYP